MDGPHPKDYRSYRFTRAPPHHFLANLGGATSAFGGATVTKSPCDGRCVPSPWAQSLTGKNFVSRTTPLQTVFFIGSVWCDGLLHPTMEDAVEPAGISQPCPRCGHKLQFRHTVESIRTGVPVDFFRCEDCGHVHTVERRAASAFSSDPLAAPEAVAKRKRA